MNWIKRNKEILFLLVWCILFFGIYSHFNLVVYPVKSQTASLGAKQFDGVKFSSPDETANYFWIEKIAKGEDLYYFEELNGIGNGLVHPRSVNAVEGKIVPGSFLGMILIYGFIAGILGVWVVPYLTPFFACVGLVFFYLLVKKLFGSKPIALLSAVLLSFTPAWMYYSARGMYHNILFLVLLLIGVYALFYVLSKKYVDNFKFLIFNFKIIFKLNSCRWQVSTIFKHLLYLIAGLMIGLAIIIRTSEIVWIAFTVLLIFILNFRKIYWPGVVMFLGGIWLAGLSVLYWNQVLYGSFISAGYRTVVAEAGIGEAVRSGVLFQMLVTPFGFNLKSILVNGFNYLYRFLPYWSAPAILGGFLWAILPREIIRVDYKKRLLYIVYYLLLIAYLLVFYGSWSIIDRIDEATLSLGTSYLRYWLPIYLLMTPLISVLIWQVSRLLVPIKKYKNIYSGIIAGMMIVGILMPSVNLVMRKTDESLFLLKNLSETRVKSELVNRMTEKDDVVVMYKQADKIFFPERNNLITELVVTADYEALAEMAKIRSVYYYTFAPMETVKFISRRDFEPYGMEIVEGKRVLGSDWMYKICNSSNSPNF